MINNSESIIQECSNLLKCKPDKLSKNILQLLKAKDKAVGEYNLAATDIAMMKNRISELEAEREKVQVGAQEFLSMIESGACPFSDAQIIDALINGCLKNRENIGQLVLSMLKKAA